MLQKPRLISYIENSIAGTDPPNLAPSSIKNIRVYVPQVSEQNKIAAFLTAVDSKIEHLSKKKALLEQYKKGMMQKLFPAKDETVPELRFPGFSGEWQKSIISDFAKVTTGNKDTQDKIDHGGYPFFVRSQTIERINSYSYNGEAILTSGDGVGVGKNFHYIIGKFDFHQRVYCIYGFSKDVYGFFIFQYFSKHFYKRVMKLSAKNSVDSIRMAMITEMPIRLPCLKEQQKIATFLSSIDKKITLISTELNHAQSFKKSLLQQMFI
ncbi:MAG: restriction endonuclease subunit S [Candidatus Electrothrix sp. AR3]|nr:restriction endonuclease subunit S [Candidatus Electrothrix sp. AR3]